MREEHRSASDRFKLASAPPSSHQCHWCVTLPPPQRSVIPLVMSQGADASGCVLGCPNIAGRAGRLREPCRPRRCTRRSQSPEGRTVRRKPVRRTTEAAHRGEDVFEGRVISMRRSRKISASTTPRWKKWTKKARETSTAGQHKGRPADRITEIPIACPVGEESGARRTRGILEYACCGAETRRTEWCMRHAGVPERGHRTSG